MRILVAAAVLAGGALLGSSGAPVATAQPLCNQLGGTVANNQMCHVHTSKPAYMLDMRFPVDYPNEQALTDYLTQNRDGFVKVAQTPGPRDVPYQMDVTTEQHHSGQPPRGTQSVVFKTFQDVGGPYPSTFYKAFTYDLDRRQPVTFDTLFASGTKPLNAIFPIVQRELGRQTGLPGAIILPGSGLDPSHYQNFAVTDDELIFFFAPGELLPLGAGATEAHVPRNAIPSLAV